MRASVATILGRLRALFEPEPLRIEVRTFHVFCNTCGWDDWMDSLDEAKHAAFEHRRGTGHDV